MTNVIPLFPLNTVVFPGQHLPLHIFEPRYRQLISDVLERKGEFGIALIARGREVGGGAEPVTVGCAVRITEVQELPDGRFNIICRGTRRFRVLERLEETPYLRASVEFLPRPDDAQDEATAELAETVGALYRDHLELTLAMEGGWQRRLRTPADPIRLADAVAAEVDAPPGEKQQILAADRLSTRLEIGQRLLEAGNRALAAQVSVRRRFKLGGLGIWN